MGDNKRVNVGSFSELSRKLDEHPDAERLRAEAEAELTEELVAYSLGELRQEVDVTQAVLAERLGIKQPSVSSLERQDDMLLSTLRNTVQALGGELRIMVKFPAAERQYRLRLEEVTEDSEVVSAPGWAAIDDTTTPPARRKNKRPAAKTRS